MTNSERIAFVQSIKTGIGGSSIASLLQPYIPVEYGCQRRLWYRLSGVEPDYPEIENEPMALGTILEKPVADAYSNLTGRVLEEVGLKKHATEDWAQVHIDRLIHPQKGDARDGKGVYEGKAVGDQMMSKINEFGLISDYLCQGQHGLLCFDLQYGAFAVGRRSQFAPYYLIQVMAKAEGRTPPPIREPKPAHFDFERNNDICDAILKVGPEFWGNLRNEDKIPDRLDQDDNRCASCGWRRTCQGSAMESSVDPEDDPKKPPLMPEMLPFIEELRVRDEAVLKAEEQKSETIEVMKTILGARQAVSVMMPDDDGRMKCKNLTYRVQAGARRLKADRIVPQYNALRAAAIEAGLPGAELAPVVADFYETGMPSRPFRTSSVLKAAKKAFVPEQDGVEKDGVEEES